MNWLAHIFLSEQSIDFQIGNYLHDPLKGKIWDGASEDLKNGMNTHMIIDLYTDSHTIFSQSKNRLRDTGLLKSIVIDITYDYFLTKNWNKYCNIPIEEFIQAFYNEATKRLDHMPINAREPLNRLIKFNVLNKYQNIEDLKKTFERFDKRLSKRLLSRDSTSSYFDVVCKNIDFLENDFLIFFPQLCNKIKGKLDSEKIKHWRI